MNKLLDVEDILNNARNCIECIFMAASNLSREETDPLQVVADIASKKIDEAIALLHESESGDLPVPADAKPKSPPARTNRRNK